MLSNLKTKSNANASAQSVLNRKSCVILVMKEFHPERNQGGIEEPSKGATIKQKWNNYVESATLHGMQHVFSSPTTLRRIVWALFLFSGIGYFSFQCTVLVKKYFSYPVNTKVTLEHESSPEFPAVTICNFNMFRQSVMDAQDFKEVVKYAQRDRIDNLIGLEVNASKIDWRRFENVSMFDVYADGGHQMKEMLINCSWIGKPCTHHDFRPVLTSMGLCHTFNSGKLSLKTSLSPFLFSQKCWKVNRLSTTYTDAAIIPFSKPPNAAVYVRFVKI